MTTVDETLAGWLERYDADGLDLGALLCDDHPADAVGLVFDGPDGVRRFTYGELGERSKRLAGSLRAAGIEPGDRVATMLPKSPELVLSLLAIWRAGAVHVPLFTAFGPEAAGYRVRHSGAKLVIADEENRAKLEVDGVPAMCMGAGRPGDLELIGAIERGEPLDSVPRSGDDLMFLLYTSGTTGQPKGVEVPVRALASFHCYVHYCFDVREDDVFWNLADPGWAYGLWYAITGPLLMGRTTMLRGKLFDPEAAYGALLEHGVTNLAGAPTAYRALRAHGVPEGFREASRLRAISSAGEPLNAELLDWGERELGVQIHDHYGQSEQGMLVCFGHHPDVRREPVAGSMGVAMPGFRVVVLDDAGNEVVGQDGELAVDVEASPLYWFRGYFQDPEKTAERFPFGPRYYLTADSARIDEDGLVHFAARADDVITSSGYRIGPFEVESALIAHPAVAEVAVIGTPDELRGEAVTAFVVLAPGTQRSDELGEQLGQFVKARLAKHLYPRHVCFVDELPRTPSGKIRRTELREQWAQREVEA
jgi:acetyl-CoA synthetase